MNWIPDKVVSTAQEVKDFALRLVSGGCEFVRSSVGALPLFAGTQAYQAEEDLAADETHYFLVPLRTVPEGYATSVQRAVPAGQGLENDLPKRRIFHLPALSARGTLEAILTADLAKTNLSGEDAESELGERLERIADEIDKQAERVTGGLLLIGGAVAIANPLVGVAIAAKALFPAIGSRISHHALKYFGGKFRASAKRGAQAAADKKAAQTVKRLEPQLFINPLLGVLEAAVAEADPQHDPHAVMPDEETAGDGRRVRLLTARAITQCYADLLALPEPPGAANLHAPDIAWLRSLARKEKKR
jgi:hypothetical protein